MRWWDGGACLGVLVVYGGTRIVSVGNSNMRGTLSFSHQLTFHLTLSAPQDV